MDGYQAGPCSDITTDAGYTSITTVSQQYYAICLSAIVILSVQLGGAVCMIPSNATMMCGSCLMYLGSSAWFAWVITLTVFVFRDQEKACNFVNNDGVPL